MTDTDRTTGQPAEHLTDADLIRILDGEPALSASHDVSAHISECDACRARRELLSERRRRLAMLLASTDVAPPAQPSPGELLVARARARRPWHRRAGVRAAAAVLLVAGGLTAQPSVRAWAGEQWRRITAGGETVPNAPAPAPTTSPEGPQAPGSGTALTFEPAAGPFTIVLDGRPTGGTLTIMRADSSRATVERVSGANLDLLVTPQGFRVRDAAGATASFLVRVPRSAQRVHVRFGPAPTAHDMTFDLAATAVRVIDFGGDERARP